MGTPPSGYFVTIPLPTDEQLGAETVAKLKSANDLNVARMLAGTADMLDGATGLVQAVFQAKDIDPKMRELIILRSAYLLDCPYEWQANVSGRAAAVTAALTDRQDLLRVPICCTPTSIRELSLSRHARWVECICLSELRLTLSPPYLLAGLRSHSRGSDLGQR